MRAAFVIAVISLLIAACRPAPSPISPSPASGLVLSIDNRGGPDLVVQVNGTQIATVGCGKGAGIRAGVDGLPGIPWDLTVVRADNGTTLWSGEVTSLPGWYVQIGDTGSGVSYQPISGPAGPPCSSPGPG
jgi:hypothetical protein